MKEYTTEVKMSGKWVEIDSSNKVIDVIRTAQLFINSVGIEFVRIKEDGKVVVEGQEH